MFSREKGISMRRQLTPIAAAVLFLSILPDGFAQDNTGRIIGVVTDPTGSVVPNAKITVVNTGTDLTRTTVSGVDGAYQVLLLPIGMYKVSAEAQGFRKAATAAQQLDINQSLRVDVKLEIGSTTETVMVEANAPLVETANATLGSAVVGAQILDAPLNGRNVLDLA